MTIPPSERALPRIALPTPLAASLGGGSARVHELGLDGCMIEHRSSLWAGRRVGLTVHSPSGPLMLDDVRVTRSRIVPAPDRAVSYVSELRFEPRHRALAALRALVADLARSEIEARLASIATAHQKIG